MLQGLRTSPTFDSLLNLRRIKGVVQPHRIAEFPHMRKAGDPTLGCIQGNYSLVCSELVGQSLKSESDS